MVYDFICKWVVDMLVSIVEKEDIIEFDIFCEDFVKMVGIVKESVIWILIDFCESGYIDIIGGWIYILNLEKLLSIFG